MAGHILCRQDCCKALTRGLLPSLAPEQRAPAEQDRACGCESKAELNVIFKSSVTDEEAM